MKDKKERAGYNATAIVLIFITILVLFFLSALKIQFDSEKASVQPQPVESETAN
jgi:predicted RND superfamily exporter protein